MDLSSLSDPPQGGILQLALDLFSLLPVFASAPGAILPLNMQMHLQAGRLDVLGNVDDLSQAGHTQGDILGRDTGKMEGVKGHLRGGLPNGLGCHRTNHLTWIGLRLHNISYTSGCMTEVNGTGDSDKMM